MDSQWSLNNLFGIQDVEFVSTSSLALNTLHTYLVEHFYPRSVCQERWNVITDDHEYYFTVKAIKPVIDILVQFHRDHPEFYLTIGVDGYSIYIWRNDETN